MLEYSKQRISVSIADMYTIKAALYFACAAKYSAHHPIYAMSSLVIEKSSVIAVFHIQP